MPSRPEFQAPPEFFYNDQEARKYTTSSRIIEIQAKLTERALELLALPDDGVPKLLLDIGYSASPAIVYLNMNEAVVKIARQQVTESFMFNYLGAILQKNVDTARNEKEDGCGSGLSGETLSENGYQWIGLDISQSMLNIALERDVDGDLLLADMGQGLALRPGVCDGAISISAVQWLCNADKSSNEPRLRLKAFFASLYRCLGRGARAVLQLYHENEAQLELITTSAMRAGFAGGVVVDYPHSTRAKKSFLVLTCGPPSLKTALPKAKGEGGESCSDESDSDEENQTVSISDRHRPRKKLKVSKKGKGREWVLKKKEQMRKKGHTVPPDTKYTARKRKARF